MVKMKKVFKIGFLMCFLMILCSISSFALPYNVDLTNANAKFLQYYDNETTGNSPPIWTSGTGILVINNTNYNGSTGKSMQRKGTTGSGMNISSSKLYGGNIVTGNISIEFDFYIVSFGGNSEIEFYSGNGTGNTGQISFQFNKTGNSRATYWSGSATTELNPSYTFVKNVWQHLKITCIAKDSHCQIQFNNNGSWAEINHRTDTGNTYFDIEYSLQPIDMYIDNLVTYLGNEVPTIPEIYLYQNLSYMKPLNNSNLTSKNVNFFYNMVSNNIVKNCSLYINNVLNQTNSTIEGNKTINRIYLDTEQKTIITNFPTIAYIFNNSGKYIENISIESMLNNIDISNAYNVTFYYNNSKTLRTLSFNNITESIYTYIYAVNPRKNEYVDKIEILAYNYCCLGGGINFRNFSVYGYELNSFNISNLHTGNYNYSIKCYNSADTLKEGGFSYFSIPYYPLNISIVSIDNISFYNGMVINNNFSYILARAENNFYNLSFTQLLRVYNSTNLIDTSNSNNITIATGSNYFGIINISYNITNYEDYSYYLNNYFYLNDTEIPVCNNINNSGVAYGNIYYFNVNCYDNMNFFLLNVSCSNGYNFYLENINSQNYLFNTSVNVSNTMSCIFYYCDGHTDKSLGYYQIDKISDKKIDFKFNSKDINSVYTSENSLITTKEEKSKIGFNIKFSEKANNSQRKIYYQASENSYYIESDKYTAWIVDSKSKTWFDLNTKDKKKIDTKVFYIGKGLWEITLYSSLDYFEFETIGKLNCDTKSMVLTSVIDTSVNILNFEFTQTNIWIYFIFIFFYVALLFMAFTFKNFMLGSFAFIVGILLAFMSLGISVILTIAFFFINIILFITFGKFTSS
jgi:hypothetical protein